MNKNLLRKSGHLLKCTARGYYLKFGPRVRRTICIPYFADDTMFLKQSNALHRTDIFTEQCTASNTLISMIYVLL